MTPARSSRSPLSDGAVLAVCCAAQFMVVLDVSIVNVALPQMRADLGLSTTGQQWVINAYTLTYAGLLLLGGRAADLFGRRRMFVMGLSIFTTLSLFGAVAQSGSWLIIARTIQGIGAAMLAPATLTLLTTTFREPDARRRALGAWSAVASSATAVGVLAGGLLTDLLNWRWVLFVNIPIGIVLILVALRISESKDISEKRELDLPGALTVTAGLTLVVYGIVSTNTHSWGSVQTITSLVVGFGLILSFLVIEWRFASDPLVPLGIFRRRTLSAANGTAFVIGVGIFAVYFFLSLYFQEVNGYSPLKAGVAFLTASISTLLGSVISTRLAKRLGPRRLLVAAPLVAAGGLIWLSQLSVGADYWADLFGPMVIIGAAIGASFVPMTIAGTVGIPYREAGLASGLLSSTRQMGGAIGLAVMATVAAGAVARPHASPNVAALHAAMTNGYDRVFAATAGVMVVGSLIALFLPRHPSPQKVGSAAADMAAALTPEATVTEP